MVQNTGSSRTDPYAAADTGVAALQNMRAAVVLYGLTMIALGVAFTLIWLHMYPESAIRAPGTSPAAIQTDPFLAGIATLI